MFVCISAFTTVLASHTLPEPVTFHSEYPFHELQQRAPEGRLEVPRSALRSAMTSWLRGPSGSPTLVTVIVSRGRGLAVPEYLSAVRVIQPVPALPTPHSYARLPHASAVFILGLARFGLTVEVNVGQRRGNERGMV